MNCLVIPDKFKGSLTSNEVSKAIVAGLDAAKKKDLSLIEIPASDGGDGFLSLVAHFKQVRVKQLESFNALKSPIQSHYLIEDARSTAYLELANTVGLAHLSAPNFLESTTFGLGVQILDALKSGCKTLYIGLGGSASNDMGFGLLQAMGFVFYDKFDKPIEINAATIHLVSRFTVSKILQKLLKGVYIYAVNDVVNSLYGPSGAAYTYGPQKGGSEEEISTLDMQIANFCSHFNFPFLSNLTIEGGGAAGGTAFGLKAFLNADFIHGFDFLVTLSNLKSMLLAHKIDIIISGEGAFDSTSMQGKLIGGLSELSAQFQLPLLVICGQYDQEMALKLPNRMTVLSLLNSNTSIESCMSNTQYLIQERIYTYFK